MISLDLDRDNRDAALTGKRVSGCKAFCIYRDNPSIRAKKSLWTSWLQWLFLAIPSRELAKN